MRDTKPGKSIGLAILILMLYAGPLKAQSNENATNTISLSLEDALELAVKNGYQLQIAQQDKELSKAVLSQTNAVFLPQFLIEETAVKTNDPVGVFGIKLRQGIITASDFNPIILNDPDATHNFTTKFEILQPVFNPEGLLQRSAAKYRLGSATNQLEATAQFIKLKIKELYYQLAILDKQTEVLTNHLETSKAYEKQAADYFGQGLINKAEYLNARVNVLSAKQEVIRAKNNRHSVNDQLALALGEKNGSLIVVKDDLDFATVSNYESVFVEGLNSSLTALEYQLKATDQMLKAARFSYFPTLNVFGAYELHDSSIFGNEANNYMIGASLKWEVFKGYKQAGMVAQRKAEQRKTELMYEQSLSKHHMDVSDTKRSIEQALNQIELSGLAVEQSEEDVRIRNDRYQQGLEKTSDLLLSESKRQENQLNQLRALYQYHISVARLEYLLETDL